MRSLSPGPARDRRRSAPRPAAVLCLVALTLALVGALSAPTQAREAANPGAGASVGGAPTAGQESDQGDVPRMPRSCVPKRRQLIPQTPLKCNLNPHIEGAPTVVLWGDSHAWQLVEALRSAIGSRKVNLVGFIMGSCPAMDPKLRTERDRRQANGCKQTGDLAIRYLEAAERQHRVVRVVISIDWELYHNATTPRDATDDEFNGYTSSYLKKIGRQSLKGTPRAFETLGRLHIPTDVVSPMPMVYSNAPDCAAGNAPYKCSLPRRGALVDERANLDRIADLRSELTERGRVVRASQYFCGPSFCHGVSHGITTFYDFVHIGATMSRAIGPLYFRDTVDDVRDQPRL